MRLIEAPVSAGLQLLGLRGRDAWLESQIIGAYSQLASVQLEEGYTRRAVEGCGHLHLGLGHSGKGTILKTARLAKSSYRTPCRPAGCNMKDDSIVGSGKNSRG